MTDKQALEYIEELINFIENNVIHCAMDNNYK